MSASTVSITANPAVRRRPVVATEKRATSVELLGANEASPAQPSPTGGNDTGTNFNGKDLSHHSILGERSSRDLAAQQAKKPVANTTNATLRRARKPPPHKPEQPRWVTVFRVFAKNFVLLMIHAVRPCAPFHI